MLSWRLACSGGNAAHLPCGLMILSAFSGKPLGTLLFWGIWDVPLEVNEGLWSQHGSPISAVSSQVHQHAGHQ